MSLQNGELVKTTDVVITGISGVFPKSENVEQFKENLFAGTNMVSEHQRWNISSQDSGKMGIIETLDRFDFSFFGVSRKQAEGMNISGRMLFEKVFEAILDAGYNPKQFKATKTGVFVGICYNELEDANMAGTSEYDGLSNFRCILANRISYWLDLRGPSVVVDTGCSSSMYALDYAYKDIQNGNCDAAIVCTANLSFSLKANQVLHQGGLLSWKGACRSFDAEADGFVRSETIAAIILQKKSDARRIYAEVAHVKTNCDGFTKGGILFRAKEGQVDLLRQCYQEINIDPRQVSYIEAHGTGTPSGDKTELNSIEEFFNLKDRTTPLKIGSVKSNMGHSEASAALCSIAKMIIAFETGLIPPNLHFHNPNPNIESLHNGKLEVVTKPSPCDGDYFGINSFGAGGSNAHALLIPHKKCKNTTDSTTSNDSSRLVCVSGRTEEGVDVILDDVIKNRNDIEYMALLHEIFGEDISGHFHRGYVILNKESVFEKNIKYFAGEQRPIWFVFTGMGSQWPTMGKSLMKIPIFAESIRKSHQTLETKGVNLIKIITDDEPVMLKNILNSFVGIAAIQIALVDMLRAIGIVPDGIIGHSVGELGCAYADECFTAEQTILSAYYRGLVSLNTKFIHGTMAVVGTSYDATKDLVPPEIDIAAHNGPTSSTISGPTNEVKNFMEELKEKNIFVREVNVSNIPYHSRYITSAGPKLISYMKEIIASPKPRSKKWICTSAPESEWNTEKTKFSSADYFSNNLLNPVYFEEGSRHIPNNAITIEIAPHGLLQAILKRSLPSTVDNIALTLRSNENGDKFLLNALGQIYMIGCNPKLSKLYPPVAFPVSKGTPMIGPLIRWQHEEQWPMDGYIKKVNLSGERDVRINLKSSEFQYLRDHVIDGRNLFPGLGYVYLVWETVALMREKPMEEVAVIFENFRFERAVNIQNTEALVNLHISVQMGTGCFEISQMNKTVASGVVRIPEDLNSEKPQVLPFGNDVSDSTTLPLKTKDFYKMLRLKGYHYKGLFKKVQCVNQDGTSAKVSWCGNFITFMDTIAQLLILQKDVDELIIPTFIRKIVIDAPKHFETLNGLDKENPEFPVNFYPNLELISSGGIRMIGLEGKPIPRRRTQADTVLETYQFVPYVSDQEMDLNTAIRLCVHIALENVPQVKPKIVELLDEYYDKEIPLISTIVADTLSDLPTIQGDVNILMDSEAQEKPILENWPDIKISNDALPSDNSCLITVLTNISNKTDQLDKIFDALKNNGFIISRDSISSNVSLEDFGLNICFKRVLNPVEQILLLRKKVEKKYNTIAIKVENNSYSWIPELQKSLTTIQTTDDGELIVYAEKEPLSGILGFFNCLRKEENDINTKCFFLMDENAPEFSLQHSMYKTQLEKNLSHNVYKNKQFGSYRHLKLEPVQEIDAAHSYVTQIVRGDLSTLTWVKGSIDPHNYSSEKSLVHVYYSALNFKDVMLGVGRISNVEIAGYDRFQDGELGFEFSGKDENGNRYMGMAMRRAITNLIESESLRTWKVPDYMSLEEACTIPAVYMTVIYAFFFKMNLRRGCSVLIHAGSGGIGQAAINICLHYECEIFITVGTPQKVQYIRNKFPQIPDSHIGNSRDTLFEEMIMEQTNGRGVDVVLNSLAEEKLHASLRCVAPFGDFLEIGKFDLLKNNFIALGRFRDSIDFHSIQLDQIKHFPLETKIQLHERVQHMLDDGIIKPLDRTVFSMKEVESAIRHMSAAKHIGKVLIKIREEEENLNAKPIPILLKAQPRLACEIKKSYIIIGGLGGFGLELADFLVCRGAKQIIFSSRHGLKSGYQTHRIKQWRSYGIDVVISTEDVTSETGVKNLLQKANSLGPVSAIFNLAMILKDGPFRQQTEESFRISAGPKAIATLHLDKLSREMCPYLEHFVIFSSVSCGRGNNEQTNYGMSNSIMERVCETRKADNLPALAIQWGVIGEVGFVADLAEDNLTMVIGGTLQQNVKSCLDTLNSCMHQPDAIVSSMIVAEKRSNETDIVAHVAEILGIKDLKTVSLTWTLPELGMDSITASELKQIIESEFGILLTPNDMKNMTLGKLYALKEEKGMSFKSAENTHLSQIGMLLKMEIVNIPLIRLPLIENKLIAEVSVRNNPTVFILPGLDGIAKSYETLAKNLALQVLCFQYINDDMPKNNLSELANHCSRFITDRLDDKQEFRIIGYSLGAGVALEVASILEKQGRKGYLWLLDGSPVYTTALGANNLNKHGAVDDESLECFVCVGVMSMFAPHFKHDDISKHLLEAKSWEARKKFCYSSLSQKLWNEAMVHKMMNSILSLLKEVFSHEYNVELIETRCTLIKCAENRFNLDENYGLSKYFKQPIRVYDIENVEHATIQNDKKTAEIIMNDIKWE